MDKLSRKEKEAFLFDEDLDEAAKKLTPDQLELLKEEKEEVIKTFSTPPGKKVFLELIGATYLFVPFITQSAASYAKEGKRELGLYYMKLLGTKDFMSLYNEAAEQELKQITGGRK